MTQKITLQLSGLLAFGLIGILAPNVGFADKPSWEGNDKHEKNRHKESHSEQKQHEYGHEDGHENGDEGHFRTSGHGSTAVRTTFDAPHRTIIYNYYAEQFRAGHCPPGLAKKQNGCVPPGQAKKWVIGRQLPRDVIFYNLPPAVTAQLGAPPIGYRYVRAADDILLISAGTGMVMDIIQHFGGM